MGIHKAWALASSCVVDFVDWFQSIDKIQCEERVWALSAALHWTNVLHCICVIQAATRNRKTFLRAVRSFNIVCAYLSAIEIPIIGPLSLSLNFLQSFWVAHAWEGWITSNSVYFALLAVFSLKFRLHLTVTSYTLTTVGSLLSQSLAGVNIMPWNEQMNL